MLFDLTVEAFGRKLLSFDSRIGFRFFGIMQAAKSEGKDDNNC